MTPDQKIALKQALNQHSSRMSIKDAAPEDVEQLPEDFQVPSYSANTSPVYDNQLFPKITSADDLIKLGYATPEGMATENGEMAISLKKAGALNDDYTLNDTGKAMMANPADLLEEENLPLYIKAKELDLDGSGKELSWGDTFSQFGKEVKEGAKNLAVLLATTSPTSSLTGRAPYEPTAPTDKEQAALNLEAGAALGGLVKSGAALATGVSKIAASGTIKALADSEAEERLALSRFDQMFEKIDRDIQSSKVSEVVDAMGQMAGAEFDAMGRMAGVELGLAGAGPDLTEARKKNIELVGEQEAAAIEKRGESAGQFAGMINPYGAAAMTGKVAFGVAGKGLGVAFKPISRSLLQADSKAALVLERTRQLASLERRAAGFQATAQAAERQAVIAESMAEKFSKVGLTDRANNALRLANQSREKGQELSTRLGGFTEEIAKVSDDLAKATQSAGVADKVLQMGQVAKQIPYLPIAAIGKTLELTGRGMIGIDKGLSIFAAKIGADKAYNAMNKISSLSGLGGAGAALGLGPAAFIPAAAKLAWATAPYLKAAGEYVSLVGKEASKARGQIGFWKRIYEMPNKGPAHRMVSGLMDTATAGGLVTGMGSRVTKGLLASYPVDLAYEWVSEGGELNPNLFKQAAVETLFFGGTGAALGGITMGSANRIKALQNGDAMNFYSSISDPTQRVMYNGMPSDLKRVVGTFSASNPGAKIQFVDQGLGAYDRNTKTVMINPNAPNPLKPLLTHEFMHHMLNNGIGDGVIANLVGNGFQTGGILRSKDGGYDAQYESFKGEYVNRLRKQHDRQVKLRDAIGDPMTKNEREFKTPDEKYLAEEYFIETNVDDMLGLVESGKLGKMAGRMIINDKVRALGDSILNKSAILRDLHFRIGGVMDNSGKMVTGNGFLGGKLYQSPEVRRMFQKMVIESVGRRGGIDAAKRKAREGVEISIQGKSDPILGELGSLWETDSDGSPLVDNNGDFVPLKKETDELRSQAGMLLVDDLKARQSRGEAIPDGELAYNPENNTWSGQYLNDKQIDLLSLSGRFNSKQIEQLRLLNEAARQTSNTNADPATRGHRFSMIYQPALKKNRKGQWKYDQIKPQLRDVVPYGVEISKDGNILIRIMSTNQLFANVSEKAASKRGRTLYDGNMETILRDANAVIDLHGKNQATDAYFKEKYAGKWEDHKKFINSVFGNVGAGHKDINPLVASDRVDAVVKSYRLDRMNKATQLVGSTQLPYQNNLIKINYLPEGEPIMDANGEPKDLRYGSRPVDQAMPEQRQMPEQATPVKRFTDQLTETPLGETFKVEVDGPLFRSVTQKDWDRIQEQGYLDSDQRYAVSKKEGVNMASSPLSAITYAPIGDNSVLLKINSSNIGLHGYAGDQYIRTWDRIKLEDIEDVGKFIGGETVPSYMSQGNESDIARKMPEVSPEDLNPITNKQEAQRLFAEGKRLFAVSEMDEKAAEITSVEMLNSYPADAIGWMEPEQAPAPSQRFMPEKLDADYMKAIESGDVAAQQKMVNNYIIKQAESKSESSLTKPGGWLTPSGRWINTGRHAHQSAIPKGMSQAAFSNLGFVRVAQYDPMLVTEGFPLTNIQKRELKNAAIERGLQVRDETRDSFGGGKDKVRMPDPVTRDDSGNIIPLSKRFDPMSEDIRYMPEGDRKVIDPSVPEKEGGSMPPSTWRSLSKVGYSPEASEKTQIATTAPTYETIVKANAVKGMEVLDFSAGRGIGTKAMRAIGKKVGFNVEGYEPFSNQKTRVVAPEYEGENSIDQIPDNSKDIIVNNAVLNVVPEDTGRQVVNQIYSKLKPGGSAFINVMGWSNIKNRLDNPKTQLVGPREVVTQKGTFQKGYTAQSLRALIEQELPDAKVVRTSHGDIGFKVTKPESQSDKGVIERSDETTEQGTPAPDSDVKSIPLTGKPIPWGRSRSRQVRFMPESDRDAFPTMTPKILAEIEKKTRTLAAIHIDRMRVGEYMGVDLQGGMFYPTITENLENGVVWAFNSTGVARTVANRAAQNKGYVKLVLMQEGNVVGNKTFANIWFNILSDSVKSNKISNESALEQLNSVRRTVYRNLEGKNLKKNPWVSAHSSEWTSVEEAREALLSMPQIERGATYFKKSKTMTKSEGEKISYQALLSQKMSKAGLPDAVEIVSNIEEPAFKGIPTGSAVAIIKFDPLGANEKVMTAKEAGVTEHMSYGYVLKGKPIAKMAYFQVVEETFPATKNQIMTQQHTDFPIRKSVPFKGSARGEIQYDKGRALNIANAEKLK